MEERISVFINGRRVEIYRGMKVKHALIAFDQRIYTAAMDGTMIVEDSRGFRLGLEGALHDGASLTVHERT